MGIASLCVALQTRVSCLVLEETVPCSAAELSAGPRVGEVAVF